MLFLSKLCYEFNFLKYEKKVELLTEYTNIK